MRGLLEGALLAASGAGIAYLAFAVLRSLAFAARRRGAAHAIDFTPPVTVLKPLRGDEPGLFGDLCSFCDQDYPDFQVIFGVRDDEDPAAEVARRVIETYPDRDLSLVVCGRVLSANRKMANVLNMVAQAKHDIIVVADSDIRVDRSYLRAVVAPFADATVGAVTCLYRARVVGPERPQEQRPAEGRLLRRPVQRLALELGAMFVDEQFAPSVLVAVALGPMDFCLGATMAVTRPALEAIGGFEAVASYLADDRMLGRLVHERGYRVELSPYVVETSVGDRDLGALWEHELRWARTMHAARPWGYSFSFLTYGLPLALAYALFASDVVLGSALLALALGLRVALHYAARIALGATRASALWLVPLRDVFGLMVWAAHFFGAGVRWRDERFQVDRSGRLRSLERTRDAGGSEQATP